MEETMQRFMTITMIVAILGLAGTTPAQDGLGSGGECVGDRDGNNAVTIDELVTAVSNSLNDCPERPIEIQFAAQIGDEAFRCGGTYPGVGEPASDFRPTDFRFYVSDIRLVKSNGDEVALALEQDGRWQRGDLALLDFEDATGPCSMGTASMNTSVRGTVPAGIYTGIRFDLGVPYEMNHQDASLAEPPLSFSSMFWNWNGGYKFFRIDSFNGDDLTQFNVHLGSTGCNGDSPLNPPSEECANPNRPDVYLGGFDPDTSVIVADAKALLEGADIERNQADTAAGCQSAPVDMDCVPVFANLGLDFAGNQGDPSQQKLFRVE
jgi:uncharacterized repeat protein (TIGR04052 family)